MQSEKVKDLKKALECCAKGLCGKKCPRFDKKHININCQDEMNFDVLTYIAELEKHIDRVESERIRIKQDRDKKDELASKFIDSYNDSLKQFAERLKEKGFILGAYKGVLVKDIDETLKEFINDRNN